MPKFLKWTLIIIAGLVILLYAGFQYMKTQTKKSSPEETVVYQDEASNKDIAVNYSRPSKRGRDIFGALVPYGEVWRTGANEATTFTTASDLQVGRQTLPAGTYTLWTIPNPERWTIIFNSGTYGWGVGFDGQSSRDPANDVVKLDVPVMQPPAPIDTFTIALTRSDDSSLELTLGWDNALVSVPVQ